MTMSKSGRETCEGEEREGERWRAKGKGERREREYRLGSVEDPALECNLLGVLLILLIRKMFTEELMSNAAVLQVQVGVHEVLESGKETAQL